MTAPSFTYTDGSIHEDAPAGTVAATLSGSDPDGGTTFAFAIVGVSTQFEIVGNELRIMPGATFTFGTNPSVNIQVTDAGAETFTNSITIFVGHDITGTNNDDINTIDGSDGDDVIDALGGNDTVDGGLGDDTIDGGIGNDTIHGDAGDDVLDGNFGADDLFGDAGNDTLTGGSGGDTLDGGSGDDMLIADDGASGLANTLLGGADIDTLDNSNSHSAATLDGGTGHDTIHASIFSGVVDTITGDSGNDTITNVGLNSSDSVNAGEGDDTVEFYGLNASGFNSTITLGIGEDTVGFGHDPDITVSYATITDFATGAGGDKIDLDRILNKLTGYTGNDPFTSGFLRLVQFDSDTTLLQVDGDGTANGGTFTTLFTLDNTIASNFTSANFTPSGFTPYVNVAPTLTAPSSVNATEQTTFDLKTAGITVADTDGNNVTLTLTITEGSLSVSPIASGATVTTVTDPVDPTIITSVTISGTVAQVNALLANNGQGVLGYIHNSDNPPASTTLSVVLSDGGNTDTDSVTINITAVNDAPVLDNLGSALFTEGGAAVPIVPSATVADLDSANLNGGTLTVSFTANGTTDDQLTIENEGIGAGEIGVSGNDVTYEGLSIGTFSGGANGADLVVSFNVNATPLAAQALVRHILFSNTSDNPSTLVRSLQFQLTDGDTGTATSSATVNVEAVNDAPALAGGSVTPYTENDAATVIDATLIVSDIDSANLTGATVSITGGFASGDVLGFVTQNGISGSYNAGTGVLTLSGTASLANYQTALRSVTYSSTSDNPSVTPRTVSFQINDGSSANNLSSVVDSTVNVTPANDAPTLDLNGLGAGTGATLNYGENDPATAVAPGATVVDPDFDQFRWRDSDRRLYRQRYGGRSACNPEPGDATRPDRRQRKRRNVRRNDHRHLHWRGEWQRSRRDP